jgi:hypothetical protein
MLANILKMLFCIKVQSIKLNKKSFNNYSKDGNAGSWFRHSCLREQEKG